MTETARPASTPVRPTAPDGVKLAALAIGFVMATLDATVVNVAGVTIKDRLGMTLSGLTWVVDGYILTFASLLLLAGSLANRFGAKRIYLSGLSLFVIASLGCGLAGNGPELVAARLVQGVGAALFMPSSLSLLLGSFPEAKRRATMLGLWTAIVSLASASGPIVGGVLVDLVGWRGIFLVNIPVGVIGLILSRYFIAGVAGNRIKLTYASHVVGVLGLSALCFVLINGPASGWTSTKIITAAAIAVLAIVTFVVRERRAATPIIPRELFGNASFAAANVIGFLLNFSLFGGIFMLGVFLQKARGASPVEAGVQLFPMMTFVVGNLLYARIASRAGFRAPMIVALATASVGSLVMVSISPSTPYWLLAVTTAIANLGVGVTVPAMTMALMDAAGRANANVASAMLNADRQIGGLVGIAVAGLILGMNDHWYRGAGMTFLVMTVAYAAATFLSWRWIGKANHGVVKGATAPESLRN